MELTAFESLRAFEQAAVPVRHEALKEDVEAQQRRQSQLQARYKELLQRLEAARA